MPLSRLIQMKCDYCGHTDVSSPPLSEATNSFLKKGYLQVNGRWYCDQKCKDNHIPILRNEKKRRLETALNDNLLTQESVLKTTVA